MKTLLCIVIILILLYLSFLCPSLRKMDRKPFLGRYYAHRGLYDNHTSAPENSLPAFYKAVEGDFGIELDVQLTKDEKLVVTHDFTLSRLYRDKEGREVPGKVYEYTFEQLQDFHILDSEERIPLFRDVLKTVNGRVPLIVEIKVETGRDWKRTCEITAEHLKDYPGVYCIESFHPGAVWWYRQNHPEVMRGQLSEDYLRDKKFDVLMLLLANLQLNFLTKPDFIAYNYLHEDNLSRRLCRKLFRNFSVAYTIPSYEELKKQKANFDLLIFEGFLPDREDCQVLKKSVE